MTELAKEHKGFSKEIYQLIKNSGEYSEWEKDREKFRYYTIGELFMKGFLLGFLKVLKLPVRLLKGWLKRRRKRSELEQKCRKHVRNFAPTHYSWQKRTGKKLTEKQKEYYRKKAKERKIFREKEN